MSLISFTSGDWVDDTGTLVDPLAPQYQFVEIPDHFLEGLGFEKKSGNQWQTEFGPNRYRRGKDHISIRPKQRLVGDNPKTAHYLLKFESFHVTFVFEQGNVQFHFYCWCDNGSVSKWAQGGHTQSHLIRQWGGNVQELNDHAVAIARDFIRDIKGQYYPQIRQMTAVLQPTKA